MSAIAWDILPKRLQAGLDRGVLYVAGVGVPWNGLISVVEKDPETSDAPMYFDGVSYIIVQGRITFGATLQAFAYPEEFEPFAGEVGVRRGQRRSTTFDMSYRVENGPGYLLHLVYGATASPTLRSTQTLQGEVDLTPFTWEIATVPPMLERSIFTSHFVVDSSMCTPEALQALEDMLYGTDTTEPTLPTPEEVVDLFLEHADFVVIDHGDGTWTAMAPDGFIETPGDGTFTMLWPNAIYLDEETYRISTF